MPQHNQSDSLNAAGETLAAGWRMRDEIAAGNSKPSDLDPEIHELIVKYAFGEIWSRPGLDVTTRRLLTMSMTLAGRNFPEFELHAKYALSAGMPAETIKEMLIHSMVYLGVPTALDGLRILGELTRNQQA